MPDNGIPSPSPSPRAHTMAQASLERPLAGAVICCTSVAPELRTTYAEFVVQMGAEHKLDLTSDVTHLLVGDTDTPKYKYVAKEREDVKVLRPEWVVAVRKQWMEAKNIDLDDLHKEHRMPTLAGTKICITGFDDLPFRARLQKSVIEHGGAYTGDLTKDVTHLIAHRPEGKKYEYGMQWQKKIVTMQWYKDTLERGMQLEESSYHPTIPQDEQGNGAWNRTNRSGSHLSKRARADQSGPEPARKLRRIASARLNSQTDDMWSDLTGAESQFTGAEDPSTALKPAKSMPSLREASANLDENRDPAKERVHATDRIFSEKHFTILGFPSDRESILKDVIRNNGGRLLENLAELRELNAVASDSKVLLAPYQTPAEQLPLYDGSGSHFQVASELFVEHCMFCKLFTLPNEYLLGQFLPRVKPPGFSKLVITSTGFAGIVPNHIDKMVRLLGAKYEQTFTRNTSVLVCNKKNQNQTKLAMAKSWSIPAVAETWLWACIKENRRASFEAYALQPSKALSAVVTGSNTSGAPVHRQTASNGATFADRSGEYPPAAKKPEATNKASVKPATVERPGTDFMLHRDTRTPFEPHHDEDGIGAGEDGPVEQPENPRVLQPISCNSSPNRPAQPAVKPKKRLFQTFDGTSSDVENKHNSAAEDQTEAPLKSHPVVTDARSLNSEIQELLNMKTKLREKANEGTTTADEPKKKLMGRALSNLSNSSSTSHVRKSRASSVDSVNTDGIGSEVGLSAPLSSSRVVDKNESNHSFTGRARLKMSEGQHVSAIAATAVYDGEEQQWSEEVPAPALTQLVYEDPEEALQLRETLAAKRRQRSKLGQKESDTKPTIRKHEEPKRIRDDDLAMGVGWGGGRRTRHKDKIAQEM